MRSASLVLCTALVACGGDHPEVAISEVHWSLRAGASDSTTITLPMESDLPPDSGFVVPNAQQAEGGALHVSFLLKDPDGGGRRFRYMIYHRNEAYKFSEANGDPLAEENFYGAFNDGFHLSDPVPADGLSVNDLVVIRSDPRNELPAAHWARNPRVGNYSLLIVAIPEDDFKEQRPLAGVEDVRVKTNGYFTEPYAYWLYGPGKSRTDATVLLVPDVMSLHVDLDLARGVQGCSPEPTDFEPFIHTIGEAARFNNVPVLADVLANGYTPAEFDSVLCFTPHDRMVNTIPLAVSSPCVNIRVDTAHRALEIRNPASTLERMRKENAGVRTRHAFTYGRYRVHAQLSPLLNDSDMWNGLTNAVWLVGTGASGAVRRICDGGYLSYASDGGETRRIDRTNYAEIDFEIMKGMPLCPERCFPPIYPQQVADANDRSAWLRKFPLEVLQQRGKVAVACTNWDLACPDPPQFGIGCQDLVLDDRVFSSHRWDRDYRAITQKSMEADDELFGPDGYWFEIDWRPTEIFWRIGPSLENMRTVGYMNSTMTSIPNVPMWLVVTQEFHNTNWWPGSPYEQGGIPFPAKDLTGRIFEVRVE